MPAAQPSQAEPGEDREQRQRADDHECVEHDHRLEREDLDCTVECAVSASDGTAGTSDDSGVCKVSWIVA